MPALVTGIISLWSGSIVSIPDGWSLCDGSAGTPDLRDRFIVGAGTTFTPADTGGSSAHTHTFTGDGHTHTLPAGTDIQGGPGFSDDTNPSPGTGTTDETDTRPLYYALAYIMYL